MTVETGSDLSVGLRPLRRRDRRPGRRAQRDESAAVEDDDDFSTQDLTPARVKARRARRRHRRGWRSPLTRRILLVNVLVLVIPILGLLHLDQYRQSLVDAELDGLMSRGQAFALSLGSTAVVTGGAGVESLQPDLTRHLMRLLLTEDDVRARVFGLDGQLIADSFVLVGPGGQVEVEELPPPNAENPYGPLGSLYDRAVDWVPGLDDLPPYVENSRPSAEAFIEVASALDGEASGMARLGKHRRLVLSAAVPVQRYRKVLGALMLTKDGDEITAAVRDRRHDILLVFGFAFAVTVLLSFYLAGTLARPIRRLAEAADLVRSGHGRKFQIPDFTRRNDEIGDLSLALREMTAALWNRLDAIEGFAADVAHEIKNPLTSLRSAVETVSRVEDPEQQRKLMTIILDDVQRLDRLISDISDASRLDAELSRAESERVNLRELLETLIDVQEAARTEDSPDFTLEFAKRGRLEVRGIEGRLGQVFRNLIANAISFSPPAGRIQLKVWQDSDMLCVAVDDDGPGLPEGKEDAVFDRFYTERPSGEKFGTHSGLGLSISRQIVEAHGGSIEAENRLDRDGQVEGARFIVRLARD